MSGFFKNGGLVMGGRVVRIVSGCPVGEPTLGGADAEATLRRAKRKTTISTHHIKTLSKKTLF
jgi:hypothetical protein